MQTVVICLSIRPKRNFLPNKPFFLSARAFDHPASVRCFAGLPSFHAAVRISAGHEYAVVQTTGLVGYVCVYLVVRTTHSPISALCCSDWVAFMIAGDGDMLSDWESMTIDELFALREEMAAILSAKLMTRKTEIEKRLRQLNPSLEAEREKCGRP